MTRIRIGPDLLRKVLLLVVTGAPGVQRLAFVTALSFAATTADVGVAAADIGIASFLALIAGGAVSGQVMARWARFTDAVSRRAITRQAMVWQLGALPVAVATAWVMHRFQLAGSLWAIVAFFCGFSVWQVERTKLLSDGKLMMLAYLELALVLVATGAAFLGAASNAVLSYGIGLLLVGFVALPMSWMHGQHESGAPASSGIGYRETAMLAMNGVVSTGRDQLTIPAVQLIAGSGMAGLVAQVSAVVAALLLLPRSITFNYGPQLSRHVSSSIRTGEVLVRYKRAMKRVLLTVTGLLLATLFFAWIAGVGVTILIVSLMAGLALIAGQLALLPSTVLTIRQNPAQVLITAIYVSLAWIAVVGALVTMAVDGPMAVVLLLISTTFFGLLRGVFLMRSIEAVPSGSAADAISGSKGHAE